jgi:hypothetical protein
VDHYTAERLFLERQRELAAAAARHSLHQAERSAMPAPARAWLARRLRAAADRIDGASPVQRGVRTRESFSIDSR